MFDCGSLFRISALAALAALMTQMPAHSANATQPAATQMPSQFSLQKMYENRIAPKKEKKIKALQHLILDGSAPYTTSHGSAPASGTLNGVEYRVSSGNKSKSESLKTYATPLIYVQKPVTYVFKAGQGYGFTSHFGIPGPQDGAFQFDPGSVLTTKDLPSGVVNAVMAEGSFNGLGIRLTDTAAKLALGDFAQTIIDRATSPERWVKTSQVVAQAQQQMVAESTTQVAKQTAQASVQTIGKHLINVANEAAAGDAGISKVVRSVQLFWKSVYLPMSILLLVLGAVLSSTKVLIQYTFNVAPGEETMSAIAGPLKGLTAIFLIPATQLIVSYSIDIGNSMTETVQSVTNMQNVQNWLGQQLSQVAAGAESAPATSFSSPESAQAFMANVENTPVQNQTAGMVAGILSMMVSLGTAILLAFQLVFMLYLFLMGPIAAALFSWPWGMARLFKTVFTNWLNAVINLSLWRFWWSVIILVMDARV
ncbi:MAG: hypothetical protein JST89_26780, partial [Cyanobacteria bacterium SZAS-4]|nr:hypothetical protein [Cyanobacteria bacterium SZAS-4]